MAYDFTFAHAKEGFDNHISNSIRGYDYLIEDTINLSQYFINDGSIIYDIGCSTGKMLKRMKDINNKYSPDANYIGIEISEVFANAMKETVDFVLSDPSPTGTFKLLKADARSYEMMDADLITSIFTLQFMSLSDRTELVQTIYNTLKPGAGFIFAEKFVSRIPKIHQMFTFMYYDYKRQYFSGDEILDKEKELRHMLKPLEREELINLMKDVGFNNIEPFWQNHSFVGYLAIK